MKLDINNLKIDVIVEKLNVEMEQFTGRSSITPINDESTELNIKIDEYGRITINGEIMVMLKSIVNHKQTVFCGYDDDPNYHNPPREGISVSIGNNTSVTDEEDRTELFDLWVEEYSDKDMWTRYSFKDLFKDLIEDHVNTAWKTIWRKDIEKARKFIIDSFDEVLNEYKDYEDKDDTED